MAGGPALAVADESSHRDARLVGEAKVRGSEWARLPLLAAGMLGIQVVWAVEQAYASPYLHDELGVKKSSVAIVLLAGPVAGLVVQPIIGALADSSTSRFGRRRPFIVVAGLICVFGVMLMGYTRFFSGIFTRNGSEANRMLTVVLAISSILFIDFAINAVMAVDRALLVDVLPSEDQPQGNAWAAIMVSVGGVIGFYLGSADLPRYLPFLGDTQLQCFAAIAATIFVAVHALLCLSVSEQRVLDAKQPKTFLGIFRDIWANIRTLPYVIQQICLVQFFAWLAWFPFLFNTTLYISEIYTSQFPSPPTRAQQTEGTRLGNRAMFFNSLVNLATSIGVPFVVRERGRRKRLAFIDPGMLWALSLLLLSVAMLCTWFSETSVTGTTFLVALLGISWAVTLWIPLVLLAEAILSAAHSKTYKRQGEEMQHLISDGDEDAVPESTLTDHTPHLSNSDGDSMEGSEDTTSTPPKLVLNEAASYGDDIDIEEGEEGGVGEEHNLAAKAGTILGIHTVFVVLPQFLSTAMSAVVFTIYARAPSKSNEPIYAPDAFETSPEAFGVIFRIGGVSSFIAFLLAWRLSRTLRKMHRL